MLLDTAGLLCYFDDSDPRHVKAVELFRTASVRHLSSYILAEFVALCNSRRLNRLAMLEFLAELQDSPLVEMHWISEMQHRAGVLFLQSRTDKTYSLCDAVSFLLMREHGIADALTTDHHFEQEGFRALLQS